MSEVKRIDIAEFRRDGYLQEVNRRFFHPLGLALEVVVEDDGSERLGGVWDYRDDPEGIYYDGELAGDPSENARRITDRWVERVDARNALGYMVQPVDGVRENYGAVDRDA